MNVGVFRALLLAAIVSLALVGALIGVGRPERWPPAETPPQQGEAAAQPEGNLPAAHAGDALARVVREPQNTWSNLAFVVAGAILGTTSATRLARAAGIALIAVGVGSFLYHASASRTWRHADVAAMYWVFLVAVLLGVGAVSQRWRERLEAKVGFLLVGTLALAVGLAAGRNIVVVGFKPFSLQIATAVTAVLLIRALAVVAQRRESLSIALQFLGIVTLFGIAVAFQTADRPGGRLFRPGAVIQAHAVWHVLAAAAFFWAVRVLDGGNTSGASGGRVASAERG